MLQLALFLSSSMDVRSGDFVKVQFPSLRNLPRLNVVVPSWALFEKLKVLKVGKIKKNFQQSC